MEHAFPPTAVAANGIDLPYELKPGTLTTWDFLQLEDELAEILGRPVDLVERKSVNRYLKEQILATHSRSMRRELLRGG